MKKSLIAILFLSYILIIGCSKDNSVKDEGPPFDMNNPATHLVYAKFSNDDPQYLSKNLIFVFDFRPGRTMVGYSGFAGGHEAQYNVQDANHFDFRPYPSWYNFKFTIENNRLTNVEAPASTFPEFSLIRKSATSQLAGKTFKGKYLKRDGSVLHENFFYTFSPDGVTVDAGLQVGTKLRTETYVNVANIAGYVNQVSGTSNDREIMILVDGKLQVNYRDNVSNPNKIYHGTFEEVR